MDFQKGSLILGNNLARYLHPPGFVNSLELAPLVGHLLHDILRPEDGLEVQPPCLALKPLVDYLLCEVELGLPQLDAVLKRPDVWRSAHGLSLDNLVVQDHLDVVQALENVSARQTPGDVVKRNAGPISLRYG